MNKVFPLLKAGDEDRLAREFMGAAPTIRAMVLHICAVSLYLYNKIPVITMVGRTGQEQASIYADDPAYQDKPRTSYHQLEPSQAVDLRYYTNTFAQWADILAVVEESFKDIPHRIMIHTPEQYDTAKKNGEYAYTPHIHVETHVKDFS